MFFGDEEIILLNYHNRGLSTIISNQLNYIFAGVTGRNTSVTEQNKGNFMFSAEIVNEVS